MTFADWIWETDGNVCSWDTVKTSEQEPRGSILLSQPKSSLLVVNGNQHKFSLFRFLNRLLFAEEKNALQLRVFSAIQLIPYINLYTNLHCSWSDRLKAPIGMSPKRILNVDLSYLPKCSEFFYRFQKRRTAFKFQAKQVLIQRAPNWEIFFIVCRLPSQ